MHDDLRHTLDAASVADLLRELEGPGAPATTTTPSPEHPANPPNSARAGRSEVPGGYPTRTLADDVLGALAAQQSGTTGFRALSDGGGGSPGELRLRACLGVEQTLRNAGWHTTSPAWLHVMADVIGGRRRRFVGRAGRRGAKSSTEIRIACGELIAGLMGWAHPSSAGDELTGVIISARRDQALDRLTSLEKVLDACKIRHKRTYQKIQVLDTDYRFQVYTANKDSVVSQTTFYALCDEVARWYDDKTGLNPADEIVKSLNPSLLTDRDACMHLVSSPWTEDDLHAKEFRAAWKHPNRAAWWFPTWVGNPTVTEEMTREEEEDERVWEREFAAIPMPEDDAAMFDGWAIEAAIKGAAA